MRVHASFAGVVVLVALLQGTVPSSRLAAPTATLKREFTRITAVRELADGRVLVADAGERALLVGDWNNGESVPVGRMGQGPGEYASLGALHRLGGDSTLLVDVAGSRWLLLRADSIVVTVPPESPAIRAGARSALGADSSGHVIATRPMGMGPSAAPATAPRMDSLHLLRIDRTTGQRDTLLTMAARPARVNARGTVGRDQSVEIVTNPLAAGDGAILFADGWIAVGRVDPYRVDWIEPDSRVVRGAPLPFERRVLTERDKQAFLAREATLRGTEPRDAQSIPDWPASVPPFLAGAMLSAADGRAWIRRASVQETAETRYDVVDRRGVLVARVALGANEHIASVSSSAVYSVLTDEDGIQHLRRHPLPRF